MKKVALAVLTSAVLNVQLPPTPVVAQLSLNDKLEMQSETQRLQYQWWNRLTLREKYIVKVVDNIQEEYSKRSGQGCVPITKENLVQMMGLVGATTDEEGKFVLSRMVKSCETANLIQTTQEAIQDIDQQIQCGFLPSCYRP